MRRLAVLAFLALVPPLLPSSGFADEVQTVRRVVQELNEALERNDTPALERIWADEYVSTLPSGAVRTKAQRLAALRSGRFRFEKHRLEECDVRLFGETAVVLGRVEVTSSEDGKTVSGPVRFTGVYVKRDGRWQNVAAHASAIAPAQR